MYAYIDPICGKPAFLLTTRPAPASRLSSSIARHLDGSPMERCAKLICESCSRKMVRQVMVGPFVAYTQPDLNSKNVQPI